MSVLSVYSDKIMRVPSRNERPDVNHKNPEHVQTPPVKCSSLPFITYYPGMISGLNDAIKVKSSRNQVSGIHNAVMHTDNNSPVTQKSEENNAQPDKTSAEDKTDKPQNAEKTNYRISILPENKINIETALKKAEERGIQNIKITKENAELVHVLLGAKGNDNNFRFNASDIKELTDEKYNGKTVIKLVNASKKENGVDVPRFEYLYQIKALANKDLDQDTVVKLADMTTERNGSKIPRFSYSDIEKLADRELNQDTVRKLAEMTQEKDGVEVPKYSEYYIRILADNDLDQNTVMKLVNMMIKNKNGLDVPRFNEFDISCLADKNLNQDMVMRLADMSQKTEYGLDIPRFDAYEIEQLSNTKLEQDTVMKYVNMTDDGSPRFTGKQILKLIPKDGAFAGRLANKTNENGEWLYDFAAIKILSFLQKINPDVNIETTLPKEIGSDYKTAKFRINRVNGDDKHLTLVNKKNDNLYKFDYETMKLVTRGENGEFFNIKTGKTIGIKNNITRESSVPGRQTMSHREVYIKKSTGEEVTEIMDESKLKGQYEIRQIGQDGRKNLIGLAEYDGNGGRHIEKNLTSLDGTKTDYVYADDAQGNRFLHYQITSTDGKTLFKTSKKHKVISDTHYQTFEDGKGYDIEIFDDKVAVTKLDKNNQKTPEVIERKIAHITKEDLAALESTADRFQPDLDKYDDVSDKYGEKWVDSQMLPALKQLSGSEWMALDKNTSKITGVGAVSHNAYSRKGGIAMSPETKPLLAVFEHELGHEKFHNLKMFKNKELIDIYEREKELFTSSFPDEHITSIEYFLMGNDFLQAMEDESRGLNETTAETNLLLNTPQSWDLIQGRTMILQQYFPNTIAKIGELLRQHETL